MELTTERVAANVREIKRFKNGKRCLKEWSNALADKPYNKYALIDLCAMLSIIESEYNVHPNSIYGRTIVLLSEERSKKIKGCSRILRWIIGFSIALAVSIITTGIIK